jgi:hypothetical protein
MKALFSLFEADFWSFILPFSSLQPSSVAGARRLRVTFTSLSVRVAALLFRLLSPDLDTE